MKHDPAAYRAVCISLDSLFQKHGDKAGTCIRRYMRIKTETEQTSRKIAELEAELGDLKKVDQLSRKRA